MFTFPKGCSSLNIFCFALVCLTPSITKCIKNRLTSIKQWWNEKHPLTTEIQRSRKNITMLTHHFFWSDRREPSQRLFNCKLRIWITTTLPDTRSPSVLSIAVICYFHVSMFSAADHLWIMTLRALEASGRTIWKRKC